MGNSDSQLRAAARSGDFEGVMRELEFGARVSAPSLSGWTPLHHAVCGGHEEVAEFLLLRGADVNAKTEKGWTALHCAADGARADLAALLIAHDVPIGAVTQEGLTALHLASERGDTECVELLLARDAPVDVAQRSGWTALHHAAHRGHIDVVRLLLKHGAAADATTQAGWWALHLAAGAGSSETVGVLLSAGSPPDAAAKDGSTALHCAVRGRAPVALPPIVRRQIAPRKKNRKPRCAPQPIWVMMGRSLTQLCRPVCNPGGSFPILGKPAASVAADPALKEVIEKRRGLMGQGDLTSPVEDRGWHEDVVRKLLAAGASVDSVTKEGYTPLHYALQDSSRLPLALALVAAGADPLHRATGGGGDRPMDRTMHPSHKLSVLRAAVNAAQDRLQKLEAREAAGVQQLQQQQRGHEELLIPPESPHTPQLSRVRVKVGAPGSAGNPPQPPRRAAEEGGGGGGEVAADAAEAEEAEEVEEAAAGGGSAPSTPAQAPAGASEEEPRAQQAEQPVSLSVAAARAHQIALRGELAALEGLLPRSAASETDMASPRFAVSTGRTPSTTIRKRSSWVAFRGRIWGGQELQGGGAAAADDGGGSKDDEDARAAAFEAAGAVAFAGVGPESPA